MKFNCLIKKEKNIKFLPIRGDFWLIIYFVSWLERLSVQQTEVAVSRLL